jgi:anaerobic sulfite reductase subunit B
MPSDERYRKFAMGLRPYRVVARRSERPGEMTLTLASDAAVASGPAGDPITPARPGQYWVLHTAAGAKVPAVDVTLPGAVPADGGVMAEVATLRVPCGSPVGRIGERVAVRGPLGTGWNTEATEGRDLLVVAWEAGLALLRPVIERAVSGGGRFRRVRVWAGGHTWAAIGCRSEWSRWSGRAGVTIGASQTLTMNAAATEARFDPTDSVALLAGPLPMTRVTAEALTRRGLPAARIQVAAHPLIRCGTGRCGHCQISAAHGVLRACQDGPVLRYDRLTDGLDG